MNKVSGIKQEKSELFLSFDIESDGPVPELFSMRSFGFAGFTPDGTLIFEFERNLRRLNNAGERKETVEWFQTEAKEAWEYLNMNQVEPEEAIKDLSTEIEKLQEKYVLVPLAWPIMFDWQFINYYFYKFIGYNPLGYNGICSGSYARAHLKKIDLHTDINLEKYDDPKYIYTHKALDDAKTQGAQFVNIYKENMNQSK
jgi:hypothetical protein